MSWKLPTREYQEVDGATMKEELVAWEMLALARREHPPGITDGYLVRKALDRVAVACDAGRLGIELESHYVVRKQLDDVDLHGGWL